MAQPGDKDGQIPSRRYSNAPDLFGHRLALSLVAPSEVMTKREIGYDPLLHGRSLDRSLGVAFARW